jgi:YaaC-like Protein
LRECWIHEHNQGMDWHKCRFLESCENLKPLVKMRFGREPSTSQAREIVACLQEGRLFYQAAETSPIEIRPLQLFYGMVGFAKALIVASQLRSLSSLKPAHGVADDSAANSRIADLRLKIGEGGTFQEFNDAIRGLSRISYSDQRPKWDLVSFESASSSQLAGISLSLRDILGRIPGLESLYRMTFDEDALTAGMGIGGLSGGSSGWFILDFRDARVLNDLNSLKQIVERWRAKFPFLKMWRLYRAEPSWGQTVIRFVNLRNTDVDEFAETYAAFKDGTFQARIYLEDSERLALEQGLAPFAGYLNGGILRSVDRRALWHLCEDEALIAEAYAGIWKTVRALKKKAKTEGKELPAGAVMSMLSMTSGRMAMSAVRDLSTRAIIQRREFG